MNCAKRRSQERSARGLVLVELALTLPVLLCVVFSGIELSRALRVMQIASTLSREAAGQAYRDCGAELPGRAQGCVEVSQAATQAAGQRVASGLVLIVSIFRYDASTSRYARLGSAGALGSHPSRFAVNASGELLRDGAAIARSGLANNQVFAVGEVYLSFSSMFPFLVPARILGAFYDVSII